MNKMAMILLPLVILGTLGGLAFTGVINVPGITPVKKKKTKDAKTEEAVKEAPKVAASTTPPPEPTPPSAKPSTKITIDENKGFSKVASLWNEMEPVAVAQIAKDWKDADLAKVLAKMDDDKVAAFLSSIDPKKASDLSKALQLQASRIEVKPE